MPAGPGPVAGDGARDVSCGPRAPAARRREPRGRARGRRVRNRRAMPRVPDPAPGRTRRARTRGPHPMLKRLRIPARLRPAHDRHRPRRDRDLDRAVRRVPPRDPQHRGPRAHGGRARHVPQRAQGDLAEAARCSAATRPRAPRAAREPARVPDRHSARARGLGRHHLLHLHHRRHVRDPAAHRHRSPPAIRALLDRFGHSAPLLTVLIMLAVRHRRIDARHGRGVHPADPRVPGDLEPARATTASTGSRW